MSRYSTHVYLHLSPFHVSWLWQVLSCGLLKDAWSDTEVRHAPEPQS